MKKISILIVFLSFMTLSCKKYLDIVPDNIATIENAFTLESTAERYLMSCYSFMPYDSDLPFSTLLSGDELWLPSNPMPSYLMDVNHSWGIALGKQTADQPLLDYWNGAHGRGGFWKGIRYCNTFLENIEKVPGMADAEKKRWIAEAKFLKAYYHFYLVKAYGPIPLIKENLPISATPEQVKLKREPVDDCFAYIVELLDEATVDLPVNVADENREMGRITKLIALGIKAKILVYAASPLFNGNTDYAGFGYNNVPLFNQQVSQEKWVKAAAACKDAITAAEAAGHSLYKFERTPLTASISEATKTQLSIRNTITEKWNSETLWANPNTTTPVLQAWATPFALDPAAKANPTPRGDLAVPLNIASLFYSENGVPIDEDNNWDYANRYDLRIATPADEHQIANSYETAAFNFDREPRFYADLGFDGGIWYGQGRYKDDIGDNWVVKAKVGQTQGRQGITIFSITGYWPKKYVYYTNTMSPVYYSIVDYPWVLLRLGDLYLLYAEALNESGASYAESCKYLDFIRTRAGLKGVEDSWTNHSKYPDKFTTQSGLREIIEREIN